MPPFKLAYRPDPPQKKLDGLDRPFQKAYFRQRAAGDHVIEERTPISDQGPIGSCVANAVCDALEMVLGLEDPTAVRHLSRLHLYWSSRAAHGETGHDGGTYIRLAMRQANKLGVCAEEEWPYAPAMVFQPPPVSSTLRASENKISGYYRVDSTGRERLEDIAWAIRSNHPVVFGTQVGENFQNYVRGSEALTPPAKSDGGHATILTGVLTQGGRYRFLDRNSWGEGWGDRGHAWLDQDYLTWSETNDLWVLTRMEKLL
jgi:hypothetical protein